MKPRSRLSRKPLYAWFLSFRKSERHCKHLSTDVQPNYRLLNFRDPERLQGEEKGDWLVIEALFRPFQFPTKRKAQGRERLTSAPELRQRGEGGGWDKAWALSSRLFWTKIKLPIVNVISVPRGNNLFMENLTSPTSEPWNVLLSRALGHIKLHLARLTTLLWVNYFRSNNKLYDSQ